MSDAPNALAFERVGDPPGIEVIDRIEQQRYSVHTSEAVEPREISTDGFQFPVGSAVGFSTSSLTFPTSILIMVHDESGEIVSRVDHDQTVSFPAGSFTLELSAQIKTYIDVEGPMEIETTKSETSVYFDEPINVRYGARSLHEHPAATVTTTADPADIMAAIETFGSALKTADPERSYPTLRGHPPTIELGEDLVIPDGLEPPDNGITLELPLDLESLFVTAPLAFYLGASLEPGPAPRLIMDDGFEFSLNGPAGFESTVSNVLKQVFFFDCVTRTEGLYQMPLDERQRVEPLVDIDFADLYDRSMATQVATFLEVPFEVVEDHLPEWPLTAHIEPSIDAVEHLPFVVNDLAVVRTASPSVATTPRTKDDVDISTEDVLTRSAGASDISEESYIQPDTTDAVEQAWIGDDIPIGASKLTAEGFRNRLDRELSEGNIEITIVVNDDRMDVEGDLVDQAYGERENLPFDVSLHRNTTVDELRDLFGRHRGFLHYIGHTERDGFECIDGKLNAKNIDEVRVESFLLNACNSYHQGLALIEAGAIGGIVTLVDIINQEGVNMGESVARLLNAGFPLRASLTIARDESIQGGQYIVVGDGGVSVTQSDGRVPTILDIKSTDSEYEVTIQTFATDSAGIGTVCMPHLSQAENYYLASNQINEFVLTSDEFHDIFELEEMPIRYDGDLYWSSSIDRANFE